LQRHAGDDRRVPLPPGRRRGQRSAAADRRSGEAGALCARIGAGQQVPDREAVPDGADRARQRLGSRPVQLLALWVIPRHHQFRRRPAAKAGPDRQGPGGRPRDHRLQPAAPEVRRLPAVDVGGGARNLPVRALLHVRRFEAVEGPAHQPGHRAGRSLPVRRGLVRDDPYRLTTDRYAPKSHCFPQRSCSLGGESHLSRTGAVSRRPNRLSHEMSATRSGYATTSERGLRWDSVPMRLWQKAKRLGVWDPAEIDFERDREHWAGFSPPEREFLLRTLALFQAGEEAVTLDLLPLIETVAGEGRIEEEMYLTSFLWEEAKHVEFFRRWLDQVAEARWDLWGYV